MIRTAALALALGVSFAVTRVAAEEPQAWLDQNLPELVELYQEFHRQPELSFEEEKTAAKVAQELRAAGATVTEKVGGHGVVGLLVNGEGPTLMLRADLDALPVVEQTGLPYASQVKVKDHHGATVGVMHACGHDLHITNLIAVTRYLAANKDRWQGTLLLVGQPAEERGAGARAMLDDGLFRKFPRPQHAVALHVFPLHAGYVGVRGGYSLANVDNADITIKGRGGHGAYPQNAIDPIVIAARLVLDLQTIVSREIKPIEPAVVTVGSIHGGAKHNVIDDECKLQLTIRSYSPEVRQQIQDAIRRKAKAAAMSAGAPEPEVEFTQGTAALFNDEELAKRMRQVFQETLGADKVVDAEPSMGGEDFSHYGKAGVPILMYWVGSIEPERMAAYKKEGVEPPSLHSPLYYPDPAATLRAGVLTMTAAVCELLPPPQARKAE